MNMSILQSVIMGLVSGFTELLPVSSEAHRAILRCLMGIEREDGFVRLMIHLGALAAMLWLCQEDVRRLRRTKALLRIPPKRRKHQPDQMSVYTLRLVRTAMLLLVFGRVFTLPLMWIGNELQILAFALLANGVILLRPSLVANGNKDPRNMPRLDGMIMGLGAALSVIPGFSQMGGTLGFGISRGVDRKFALKFACLLLVPGLLAHIVFDIAALFAAGELAMSLAVVLSALVCAVSCFAGCVLGYRLMNFLVFSTNFSAFSYYCFGAGLFSFILFLMI